MLYPRSSAATSAGSPQPSLPRVPYLHKRDGWYYFKRKVPAAIQWAFGDASQIWKSLETSNRDQAVKAIKAHREAFDADAARARQGKGAAAVRREQIRQRGLGTCKYMLDAHIEPLLDRFEHALLVTDDEERASLSLQERAERRLDLEAALAQMLEQAATENFAAYEETAQQLLTGERLIAPPGSAVRRHFMRCLLQRDIHVVETQIDRLRGKVTPTSRVAPVPPRLMPTMLDVFEHWAGERTNQRTIDTYRGFVAEFEHIAGALPCVAITGEKADLLTGRLAARECSRETAENYLGGLATLFRHGVTARLFPGGAMNPFEGCRIDIEKRLRSMDRRAYELDELKTFFTSRLYTSGYRPEGQTTEAAYWCPLLAALCGGRIEELCQAGVNDVLRINGVWTLRIAELEIGQGLKNDGSWRYVPIHEELIRCGFLVYVASVRLAGKQRLFPSLRNNNKYR